jgi:hypothetical protein
MQFRKTPSEEELATFLREGRIQLPPLRLEVEEVSPWTSAGGLDAFVRVDWEARRYRFVVELKRLWTPKVLSEAIERVRRFARPPEFYPMVVVPYLPESRLAELESAGVSGIDLCGNGIVAVSNELFVYRSGRPNRFRSEAEIKNVFRGNSSLVARAFLVVPEYPSVQDAGRMIRERGGSVTLPTVSKVCKSLESMLVIERKRGAGSSARQLRLLQPDKLLDFLETNYAPPSVTKTVRGKTKLSPEALRQRLTFGRSTRVVQTGFGSVGNYAVMATEPTQSFYSSDIDATLASLGDAFEATDRFANVAFSETKDDTVYFDKRPGLVASPVQAYLELATGDKRSKETAEQVRRAILEPLEPARRVEG